jgi:hypothetical protein
MLDRGADPNYRASLRARLEEGHGGGPLRDYRNVTPIAWGEQYHAKIFVSRESLRLIEAKEAVDNLGDWSAQALQEHADKYAPRPAGLLAPARAEADAVHGEVGIWVGRHCRGELNLRRRKAPYNCVPVCSLVFRRAILGTQP